MSEIPDDVLDEVERALGYFVGENADPISLAYAGNPNVIARVLERNADALARLRAAREGKGWPSTLTTCAQAMGE